MIYKGYVIRTAVLDAIVDPDRRLLWQFIERDGEIQAVPYTEDQVIWLERKDYGEDAT